VGFPGLFSQGRAHQTTLIATCAEVGCTSVARLGLPKRTSSRRKAVRRRFSKESDRGGAQLAGGLLGAGRFPESNRTFDESACNRGRRILPRRSGRAPLWCNSVQSCAKPARRRPRSGSPRSAPALGLCSVVCSSLRGRSGEAAADLIKVRVGVVSTRGPAFVRPRAGMAARGQARHCEAWRATRG
jgi:hypothetical protein